MGITKLAFAKKLFGGGGGKREGTAIPAGEEVNLIFFNLSNTIEETNAILSQLTFVQTPLLQHPIYAVYARTDDGNEGIFVIVVKMDENHYAISQISNIANATSCEVFNGANSSDWRYQGWLYSVANTRYALCDLVVSGGAVMPDDYMPITNLSGIPIGAENEKIKNVLSITPF